MRAYSSLELEQPGTQDIVAVLRPDPEQFSRLRILHLVIADKPFTDHQQS
jgi:hypothetical protein